MTAPWCGDMQVLVPSMKCVRSLQFNVCNLLVKIWNKFSFSHTPANHLLPCCPQLMHHPVYIYIYIYIYITKAREWLLLFLFMCPFCQISNLFSGTFLLTRTANALWTRDFIEINGPPRSTTSCNTVRRHYTRS